MASTKKETARASAASKAADSIPAKEPAATQGGLPLFFKKPVALEKSRHAKSGLSSTPDLSFAKEANSVALTALEFIEASKFYPIVFSATDDAVPLAILGLEKENYFVEANGAWRNDAYVPAYIRQYPFVFFENESEQKFYLCVDEKSPQFRVEGGEDTKPFFNADGSASPLTNQALEFCNAYHRHHLVTREFVADLKKHDLLLPYQSSFTLKTGRSITLSGFMMINEAAFNALPADVFNEFRSKGWLAFIYLAMASTSNWKRLSVLADEQAAN